MNRLIHSLGWVAFIAVSIPLSYLLLVFMLAPGQTLEALGW